MLFCRWHHTCEHLVARRTLEAQRAVVKFANISKRAHVRRDVCCFVVQRKKLVSFVVGGVLVSTADVLVFTGGDCRPRL